MCAQARQFRGAALYPYLFPCIHALIVMYIMYAQVRGVCGSSGFHEFAGDAWVHAPRVVQQGDMSTYVHVCMYVWRFYELAGDARVHAPRVIQYVDMSTYVHVCIHVCMQIL